MSSSSTQTATESGDRSEMLYAEDMKVGDVWLSETREISADDVADFAMLTGDHDPLHIDDGAVSPFGEPVAHGLLGMSVMAGLSSQCPNAATLALVSVDGWEFVAPIFFGDRIQVRTELESLQPHGRRAAKIVWVRQLINQNGRVVQSGRLTTLVANRARTLRSRNGDSARPKTRAK